MKDTGTITSISFNWEGDKFVVASSSCMVYLCDFEELNSNFSWKPHDQPITSLCFDKSNTLVASGSTDKSIKIWDIDNKYCTHNFRGHEGIVTTIKFHPNPSKLQLFSASHDNTIRVWDLQTKKCTAVLSNHLSIVTSLQFSASGTYLFSGGRDKVFIVWDLKNNNTAKKTVPVYEAIEDMLVTNYNTQEDTVVTVGEKGIIKMWDWQESSLIKESSGEGILGTSISYILKTQNSIISARTDHSLIIHDNISLEKTKLLIGFHDEIIDIKYITPTSLAVATNSEQVKLLNLKEESWNILEGHTDIVICLDVSIDNTLLLSGSKDSSIRLWNINKKQCVAVCEGHTEAIGAVSFSKKSNSFFVSGSRDKTIKYWQITSGGSGIVSKYTVKGHDKDISCLSVSPNDKFIASGGQDKLIKLWNIKDGSLQGTLKGHTRGIWSLEFSPVEKCLVSSSGDKSIKLWSLTDFICLKSFEGHTNSVLRVAFNGHGTEIISTSSDGIIKIWDIKSNECINTIEGHSDKIWAMAISKDEKQLITAAADSQIHLWKDSTEEENSNKRKEEQERILKEQELSNSLLQKDYSRAIFLAFSLEQPFKLLNIFETMMNTENDLKSILVVILEKFTDQQLQMLIKYIRDWNTSAKFSNVAERVLAIIFTIFSPQKLESIPQIKEVLYYILYH